MVGHTFWVDECPKKFMWMMDDILRHFTNSFVVVYFNNILISRWTWEEHIHDIR